MAATNFVRGEFRVYRSTSTIHLGAIQKDIVEDDEFEFDGQTLKYGGQSYSLPSIRGGIQAGWFVPADDKDTYYVSKPAGVQVRPATSAGAERGAAMTVESASEEEAVVGSLGQHQTRREDMANQKRHTRKAAAPPPQEAPAPVAAPPARRAAPAPRVVSDRRAALQAELAALDAAEAAEAAPRQKVAVARPNRPLSVEEADEINRRALDAERTKVVPPKAEHPPEEELKTRGGFAIVTDQQEGEVIGKKYSFSDTGKVDITKTNAAAIDARVGPVAETPQREVMSAVHVPAEGNTDIHETLEGGATGDVAVAKSGEHLTDLLGETAAAAGPDPSNPLKWDMTGQWRTRVKTAVEEYGQSPDALRQILAVETPAVRKHIGIALKKLHGK
jgi:hypothetical protein